MEIRAKALAKVKESLILLRNMARDKTCRKFLMSFRFEAKVLNIYFGGALSNKGKAAPNCEIEIHKKGIE